MRSKKRDLITLIIGLAIGFLLLPYALRVVFEIEWWYYSTIQGAAGYYSEVLRDYRCTSPYSCRHEQGHKEDHLLGWFSDTQEFEESIEILADCKFSLALSQLPYIQFSLKNGGESGHELYAEIYASVDFGKEDYGSLKDLLMDYAERCENE